MIDYAQILVSKYPGTQWALDGKTYDVQFDDWMFLMDERVMLNKAVMTKWGIRLGEVTLSFVRRSA